jgi:hypothetical protein
MPQPNDPSQSQLENMMGPSGDNVMNTFVYSQSKMREGLALYIAAFEQPFSFGQDLNFEEFQQTYVNPQFKRVYRNMVKKDTVTLYNEEKKLFLILYHIIALFHALWIYGPEKII